VALVVSATGLLAAGVAPAGHADWNQPSGAGLGSSGYDWGPSVAVVAGIPYVAWLANEGGVYQVRVKRLEGSAFEPAGGDLNVATTQNAGPPVLGAVGGVPYVVWSGAGQIRVRRFDGTNWVPAGADPLNLTATPGAFAPVVTDINGTPYVAWTEVVATHGQVFVKRFDGTSWVSVGSGPLNISTTMNASNPSIGSVGGVPYVAWRESDGSHYQIYVKRFQGSSWVLVGSGSLNVSPTINAGLPSMAVVAGIPYVAWDEDGATRYVHVKRFDGTDWVTVGGGPVNYDPAGNAAGSNMASIGGVPVVGFQEFTGTLPNQVRIKRLDGAQWVSVGGSLNVDPSHNAFLIDPAIADSGGVPYVTWQETNGSQIQVFVKRLEPDILSEDSTPSVTSATLTAQLNDYRLPLPVGFELGSTDAFGTQTPLQSTPGTGISTISAPAGGLTPATTYLYRAFGSDAAGPTSRGATRSLATLPAPPPPLPIIDQISKLKIAPSTFVAAASGPTVKAAKARRTGAVVSYVGTQAAKTTFTILRSERGRRNGTKCVAPTRANRAQKHCTRLVAKSSFTHDDLAGAIRFRFTGRNHSKRLPAGSYELKAVPRNAAGAGRALSRAFRIKR
jgi:hypothetical protein